MGNSVRKCTKAEFKASYSVKAKLGEGNFAVVHRCVRRSDKKQFAVKIIKKSSLKAEELAVLHVETDVMAKIDHPNCVRLYEMFDTPKKLYMVLELLTGGELFDRIVKLGSYSESDAASVVKQVAEALEYLHRNGVAHRDLKPENLLYATEAPTSPVKVTDFGLAKFHKDQKEDVLFSTQCGTPGYVAPEVLRGQPYTTRVDMWSLGVILYILLCGYPPFYAENNTELYRQIKRADYDFQPQYWSNVSGRAKDLVRKLLTVDPARRLTANQVLQHPWIADRATASTRDLGQRDRLQRTVARQKVRNGFRVILALNKFRHAFVQTPSPNYSNNGVDVAQVAATAGLTILSAGTPPPAAAAGAGTAT